MANLNKVFLMGNLTSDPELRHTSGGNAVADLRLAINRTYTTKDGDRRDDTLFIDVTVWNRTAENCCQYLRKGRPVHVEGYLKTESWDDKSTGEKRYKTKVEAERVQFLGGRQDGPGGGGGGGGDQDDEDYNPASAPRRDRESAPPQGRGGPGNGAPTSPRRPSPPPPPEMEGDEDDIPF